MAIPLIALAGLTVGKGILQGIGANRVESQNPRPVASVDQNLLKNQATLNYLANQGLNAEAQNQAVNQLNLGLSSGLRSQGLFGRGGFNANTMLRTYNQGVNNLVLADEQMRRSNLQASLQANREVARENQRVWEYNQARPYEQTRQDVASRRRASAQNIFGGLGALGQAYMFGAFGGQPLAQQQQASSTMFGAGGMFDNASLPFGGLIS